MASSPGARRASASRAVPLARPGRSRSSFSSAPSTPSTAAEAEASARRGRARSLFVSASPPSTTTTTTAAARPGRARSSFPSALLSSTPPTPSTAAAAEAPRAKPEAGAWVPSPCVAWALWACLGWFGAHLFYLRRRRAALLALATLNFLLVGWVRDAVNMREHLAMTATDSNPTPLAAAMEEGRARPARRSTRSVQRPEDDPRTKEWIDRLKAQRKAEAEARAAAMTEEDHAEEAAAKERSAKQQRVLKRHLQAYGSSRAVTATAPRGGVGRSSLGSRTMGSRGRRGGRSGRGGRGSTSSTRCAL